MAATPGNVVHRAVTLPGMHIELFGFDTSPVRFEASIRDAADQGFRRY